LDQRVGKEKTFSGSSQIKKKCLGARKKIRRGPLSAGDSLAHTYEEEKGYEMKGQVQQVSLTQREKGRQQRERNRQFCKSTKKKE